MNAVTVKQIIFARTFNQTMGQYIDFKSQWTDKADIKQRIGSALNDFRGQVSEQPLSYARIPELIPFGMLNLRHAIFDDIRFIYDVVDNPDGSVTLEILLMLSTKQSIVKQLENYCLYSFYP
ncbi:hypothetical protein SAMN04488136_13016 [Vibrio xiamenensis]|uniref:ParE toxin of type II toxin-antitoxin system, parDE n=1 Tax=Vibrio xiamenensis TaxID=861298 RepID=A0A1G8FEA4_9VIBR|nr:hypothetical protein [Vibrio xiamenensis]SDH80426.1 hypothetical protein SAMN04488136_13016 [Vibrio xiamenensis]